QNNGCVASQTAALAPEQGCPTKALAKFLLAQAKDLNGVESQEFGTCLEGGIGATRRLAVPRTHLLADVAAEDPITHLPTPLERHLAAQFNGQVADAAASIQHSWSDESLCGTGVKTGRAGAAVTGIVWRIGRQIEVEE